MYVCSMYTHMAGYLFGWPHNDCLFGSQWGAGHVVYNVYNVYMGGWYGCIRGFDSQPAQYLFVWFTMQCNAMGGLVMYTGFDTQPAQWERALKTASLCRAFNLLYSVHLVVHLQ